MIVFDLCCVCGFQFEGWFHDHHDYERQEKAGLLRCPRCDDYRVHKILSPVSTLGCNRNRCGEALSTTEDGSAGRLLSRLQAHLAELKSYICTNFEDVGANLASTALKIHYGVEEPRNIRGVVTSEEEVVLKKEGIELLKVPVFKDDETSQ